MTALTDVKPCIASLSLNVIKVTGEFRIRSMGIADDHVRALATAIRNGCQLPPVLVWEDVRQGASRIVLLDGEHRLAAYASTGRREGISAVIVHGSFRDALKAAVSEGGKSSLELTQADRLNAAWRMTRTDGANYTLPEIARCAGVGQKTAFNMRQRWKRLQQDGHADKVTARWSSDRFDVPEHLRTPFVERTDAARRAYVKSQAKAVSKIVRPYVQKDCGLLAEVLCAAIGRYPLRLAYGQLFASSADEDDLSFAVSKSTIDNDEQSDF